MRPRLALLALALALQLSLVTRDCLGQVITTVAGSSWVFRGNGGLATKAPLGQIGGVATDAADNVYVADPDNNIVVKVSPAGILTVVAGTG
ncbi:MAG: hypothetical protein NTZ98_16480 [Acidobacteria bacterium]|nr:hypothetical protein [Acidobacteriota bacterium]